MIIRRIFAPYLYAVKYDGDDYNIYRLTYNKLTDDTYLSEFFEKFGERISDYNVDKFGIDRTETEEYAAEVNDEMIDLSEELERICQDIRDQKVKDFGFCFEEHSKFDVRELPDGGGRSVKYSSDYLPVKCKGVARPSLVRIYAIELSLKCYIIVYGGIKVALDTNDSPDLDSEGNESTLEKELRARLTAVCRFLTMKGIVSPEGLSDYLEEEQ